MTTWSTLPALVRMNLDIHSYLIEEVGQELRAAMSGLQAIASA
ncbi:hypothetical protein ACFL5J_00725 [Thermodesulfobacteriota bacterium]